MSDRRRVFSLSRSAKSSARPEAILERILRPATWPTWVPEITSTESKATVGPGDDVDGKAEMLGFRIDGRARVTEVTTTTFVQDVVVGVRMVARYVVEPTSDGTIIRHELEVSSPQGPMGRVLAFLLWGRLRSMQRRLLRNLAEGGEF